MNKLQSVMSGHRWIIDGNYASTMKTRFEACDTVFFLDYPLSVCLDGIESRRGQPRSDMPWIENDCADEEFLNFIKNYNEINRPRVIELIKTHSEKNVIVFHSREEAEEYIKAFQQ